ncbi:DNA-directed DNA polymerase [Tanacetum coccineum]
MAWQNTPTQNNRRKLDQFTQFRFYSLTEKEGLIRIKEYVQYQDDLWDDMSPPMNISSILETMRPTFRRRLKRACRSHEANECEQTGQAEQVCLSGGDIYDDPSLLRSKFEVELANFMLEKKSQAKGIGDMLVQHRISTQDPPFLAPPRPVTGNFTEGEIEKEGPEGAEPSIIQELKKDDEDERLLSIFKKIHINMPFIEAIIHMPKGAKVLKDLLSHKEKPEKVVSLVKLSEECSAIIQRSQSQKEGDPGSFTLPSLIGPLTVKNALADLGTSINLMPNSLFQRLGISKLKPTKMSIQLADRSIKYPIGVYENLLVKVSKFIFQVNFVVLEMDEDELGPIILGRPLLAMARAVIDVHEGKLSLRVESETITFNIGKYIKSKHSRDDYLYCADHTAKLVQEQWVGTVNHDGKWTEEEEEEDSNKALDNDQLSVVISSALSSDEKSRLLEVLRNHKGAIAWSIADIKGIDSSFCTHKILMEDEFKPSVQPQRRVNPNIKEMLKRLAGHEYYCFLNGFPDTFKSLSPLKTKRKPRLPALTGPSHTNECLSDYAMP